MIDDITPEHVSMSQIFSQWNVTQCFIRSENWKSEIGSDLKRSNRFIDLAQEPTFYFIFVLPAELRPHIEGRLTYGDIRIHTYIHIYDTGQCPSTDPPRHFEFCRCSNISQTAIRTVKCLCLFYILLALHCLNIYFTFCYIFCILHIFKSNFVVNTFYLTLSSFINRS